MEAGGLPADLARGAALPELIPSHSFSFFFTPFLTPSHALSRPLIPSHSFPQVQLYPSWFPFVTAGTMLYDDHPGEAVLDLT